MAKNSIYLELDALFDTRYAMFFRFDSEAAIEFMKGGFRTRLSDEFWRVSTKFTQEEWVEAWKKRDISLLQESPITSIPSFLTDCIESIDWDVISPNDPSRLVSITINTYPYSLEPEVKEAICYHLGLLLPTVDKISTIFIPTHVLAADQLLGRYDLVVMYNFHDWVKMYEDRFADEFEFRNLMLAVPQLFKEVPEKGSEDHEILGSLNAFSVSEYLLFGRCELRMIPVADFSAP